MAGTRLPALPSVETFAFTYFGTSLGTIVAFIFGAVAVTTGAADAMHAIQTQTGVFGYVLILLFLINIIGHNGMNLYGAVLSFITAAQTFRPKWVPRRNVRVVVSAVLLAASTVTALWASNNFLAIFLNAIFAMRIVLAPWIAINLVDFYLVNDRHYQVSEIIGSAGGAYGSFNFKAIGVYVFGIAIQVPFMEERFFHGPWASLLGGADISWRVGLVATAIVYYVAASKNDSRSRRNAPAGAHASKQRLCLMQKASADPCTTGRGFRMSIAYGERFRMDLRELIRRVQRKHLAPLQRCGVSLAHVHDRIRAIRPRLNRCAVGFTCHVEHDVGALSHGHGRSGSQGIWRRPSIVVFQHRRSTAVGGRIFDVARSGPLKLCRG
ncbi:cytosine/purines uracil thiamine allantoin permease [Caballeronia hypogeia]|uniref:Cytosine/purines uracil thiamine allantoin permease n=1 Tax=Caballeronia hypogeia TaxID=1777140 RepID=A0A158BVH3_9BURK|nr:cytosine/purines uracil thiamine allantoin permease [Caballeronia hypogeia]